MHVCACVGLEISGQLVEIVFISMRLVKYTFLVHYLVLLALFTPIQTAIVVRLYIQTYDTPPLKMLHYSGMHGAVVVAAMDS